MGKRRYNLEDTRFTVKTTEFKTVLLGTRVDLCARDHTKSTQGNHLLLSLDHLMEGASVGSVHSRQYSLKGLSQTLQTGLSKVIPEPTRLTAKIEHLCMLCGLQLDVERTLERYKQQTVKYSNAVTVASVRCVIAAAEKMIGASDESHGQDITKHHSLPPVFLCLPGGNSHSEESS